jgi:hypothetical protein
MITTVPQRTPSLHGDITVTPPGRFGSSKAHPGDSSNVHPAALQMDEKQHVEVTRPRSVSTSAVKKSVPASSAKWVRMMTDHGVVPLRSGGRPFRRRTLPNRLIGNHIPEIGHGACDPVVAPVLVLAHRANDQLLYLALEPRSAPTLTGLRAREFTGDQLAVPGQDRVRPGDGCAASARTFATQAMTNLAERGSLGIREHQSAFLQDAVFGGQIFVPGQQLSPQKMYRNATGTAMLTSVLVF